MGIDGFAVFAQPLRDRQRRDGFRAELIHAGRHQLAEQIQLQAEPRGGDLGAHLQRIASDVRQVVAFIQHQQQVFWVRQDRLALHCRHYQRMVGDHHFRLLDLTAGDEERALAIVMAIAVQAAGFVGAEPAPQVVADGLIGVIAQAVPLIAVEIGFELRALLLLGLVIGGEFVIEKRQQILLGWLTAGKGGQVARTDVAPAAKGGGKAQLRDDFAQQGQVFAVDLILQSDVGGTDHQRFLFFPGNGDAGDQVGQGFTDAGRGFNCQMSALVTGQRFCHIGNHLPLRCAGNEVGDLLL